MIIAGIEFGYLNPTIIVVVDVDGKNNDILFEFKQAGFTISQIIKEAKALQKKYKISAFHADPTQPAYTKELNKAGLNVKRADCGNGGEVQSRTEMAYRYALCPSCAG